MLRTFSRDTTSAQQKRTADRIGRLEEIVVAYGLDTPLATREGQELLREVVAWEAGGGNMRWDAAPAAGAPERRALAPGLGGRFRNPKSKQCERYVQADAATIVIPAVPGFTKPTVAGTQLRVIEGEPALMAARVTAAGRPLSYVRVGPVVLWRDYAVVATRRVTEAGDSVSSGGAQASDVGNASYVLHRGSDGWRLLVIARTW